MFQRTLDKNILIVLAVSLSVAIATITSQIKIRKFSYTKISEEVKNVFTINEDMLKEYKYPMVSTQIFSSIIQAPPKIEQPKVVFSPPVIDEPPRDPYENYKNELRTYVILGLMRDGEKLKVFLAKGDNTFILGIGDKITDKLFVKEIAEECITVGLVDDPEFQMDIRINK